MSEDRKQERREQILAAAQKVFVERGFHETGIADIAAELGIGHGTVYRYFKNKHDIASAVLDLVLQRLGEVGLAENPEASNSLQEYRAQTRRILENLVALTRNQPKLAQFFQRQGLVIDPERLSKFYVAFAAFTARFVRNGIGKGFLRSDIDVEATSEILVTLIFEGASRALSHQPRDTAVRWMESGMALMFDGIAARP